MSPRLWPLLFLAAGVTGRSAQAGSLRLEGQAWLREFDTEGQPSWLQHGFGRLTEGATAPDQSDTDWRGQLHVGLDWRPSEILLVHLHGLARREARADLGHRAGLTEAFVQFRPELSPTLALRLRAGIFIPQTSRENVGPLWSSPYTLTLSALNSWLGEEARVTGLESALVLRATGGSELQLAGTVFGATDTLGTLIAWRGWGLGDRLVTLGETLPLPRLASFAPGAGFADQQPSGSQPIDELDHRLGRQVRTRWAWRHGLLLQAAYLDNGGDRRLHRGQYSWKTRFGQAGAELELGRRVRLVAEAASGSAGMGPIEVAHVDLRFRTAYLLASWGGETARLSARYDHFRNQDRDGTAEPDQESGWAWTVAGFWRPQRHLRLGLEFLTVRAARPAAAFSEADPDTGARQLMGEARLIF